MIYTIFLHSSSSLTLWYFQFDAGKEPGSRYEMRHGATRTRVVRDPKTNKYSVQHDTIGQSVCFLLTVTYRSYPLHISGTGHNCCSTSYADSPWCWPQSTSAPLILSTFRRLAELSLVSLLGLVEEIMKNSIIKWMQTFPNRVSLFDPQKKTVLLFEREKAKKI